MEDELGVAVSKYTREGVNVSDRKVMIQHYLNSSYSDSTQVCLYGVDLCTFTGEGLSKNSYTLFYPFLDDKAMQSYIRCYANPRDYWTNIIVRTHRFNDDGIKNAAIRGILHDWSNKKYGIIDVEAYKKRLQNGDERNILMNQQLISEFKESIKILTDNGIKVILINPPTLDLLNNYEPEKYKQMIKWFEDFANSNDMVEYWDFNPEYSSKHDLFYDRLHLNAAGQNVITTEVIEHLRNIL